MKNNKNKTKKTTTKKKKKKKKRFNFLVKTSVPQNHNIFIRFGTMLYRPILGIPIELIVLL